LREAEWISQASGRDLERADTNWVMDLSIS